MKIIAAVVMAILGLFVLTDARAEWISIIESDPMTDERLARAIGFTESDEDQLGPAVMVRCNGEELRILFFFGGDNMRISNQHDQTIYDMRFDQNPMESYTGYVSSNAAFVFAADDLMIEHIEKFKEGKQFLFRAKNSSTREYSGPFAIPLEGAGKAIDDACGQQISGYKTQQKEEARLQEERNLEQLRLYRLEKEQQAKKAKKGLEEAEKDSERKAKRARLLRQLSQGYKNAIRRAVAKQFSQPANSEGASCTVRVRLIYPNEIVDVQVEQCTGGGSDMSRAVEKAIWAAGPFPLPPHKAVFKRVLIFDINSVE